MPTRATITGLVSVFAAAQVFGCSTEQESPVAGPGLEALQAVVTGAAAANLGAASHFTLDGPTGETRPTLTAQQASKIAELTAIQFGPMIGRQLEAQHGGPIDFNDLHACEASLFATSSFEPAGLDGDLPEGPVYYYGSFWITSICNGAGQRQVSVAVAANAITTEIVNGQLRPLPNSLKMVGIPASWSAAVPVSAEGAAVLAAAKTGKKIATVPRLIAPNPVEKFPQAAIWVFDLDSPVDGHGGKSNRPANLSHIFVGSDDIPTDSELRGPVRLRLESPGGRRQLPFWWPKVTGRNALEVKTIGAIDIEELVVNGGGH